MVRVLRTGQRPALPTIAGIDHRVLIGDLALGQPLQADTEPCRVHHDEHRPQTLVLFADHIAGGAVIVHHAGGIAVNAHLILDRATADAVALAQRSVLVDQELGHDEQRDALGAVGRTRRLCQHQMDDILREVMLAGGNEDLLAGNGIAAARHRFRLGPDQAQIGAAMGLGQVHRPGPFARNHPRRVNLFLLFATLGQDRCNGPLRQAGVHFQRLVGRDHELHHRIADHPRQTLPAIFFG